jgi:hypothetical protein
LGESATKHQSRATVEKAQGGLHRCEVLKITAGKDGLLFNGTAAKKAA